MYVFYIYIQSFDKTLWQTFLSLALVCRYRRSFRNIKKDKERKGITAKGNVYLNKPTFTRPTIEFISRVTVTFISRACIYTFSILRARFV